MKKLLILPALILAIGCSTSSDYEDVWTKYSDWNKQNQAWLAQQEELLDTDGQPFYTKVTAPWDQTAYVLMHFYNDRQLTADNLVPLYTSTFSVKYIGYLCNGNVFDSSFGQTDSLFTSTAASVIPGWAIALANMHVGDSCDVVIPYEEAYYLNGYGSILPFSNLRFSMKLVDIPLYEIN